MRRALATFALLFVGMTAASAAPLSAIKDVTIQNLAFAPATILVTVGDSVKWTNLDGATHSAKALDGSFDTGFLAQNYNRTITFNTAGSFAYICGVHGASMSGTVVVQAAATPTPTQAPTQPPTPVPTPRPTLPPTPQPTVAPTPPPTVAPTVSPAPTTTPVITPAPSTNAPVAVASSAATGARAVTAVTSGDAGPGQLLVVVGVVVILGLVGLVFVLGRR